MKEITSEEWMAGMKENWAICDKRIKQERKQTLKEVLDYCEKEEEANKECVDTGDKFCGGYITGLQYVEQYLEKEIKKLGGE